MFVAYHMFVTTSLKNSEKGCLAHFVSEDLENWHDFGKPIYISANQSQPECPDFITYHGKNHLIFSINAIASYVLLDDNFEIISEEKQIQDMAVPKGAVFVDEIIFIGFCLSGSYASVMTFKRYKDFE